MGILAKIKDESKKSGQSKGKFIYFREGEKKRVRFLTDIDDGLEITFHDSYELSINAPCQELFGRECEYCEREDLRTRSLFIWSVYDYEAKEVKILMQAANNCTAVPALVAMNENYGTITDRDYIITKSGSKQNTTYSVVPMDKNKFRNEKAKPLSDKAILKYLDKAYPVEGNDDEEDDYKDELPKKGNSGKRPMNKPESDENEYEDLTAQELYKLCISKDIEAEKRKPEKYYIRLLKEFDEAHDDWEEDDDEWEDD